MKIQWSAATRHHDWKSGDKTIPIMIIQELMKERFIGNLEWIKIGMHNERRTPYPNKFSILDYLDFNPKRNDLYVLLFGGTKPFNWEFTLALSEFNPKNQRVLGYNNFNLWFEKENIISNEDSNLIFNAFQKIHHAGSTEFAFIHPHKRWVELIDPFHGAYAVPVTFNPMFTGVYWSTFLGEGQLELFDSDKINKIISDKIFQKNDEELYIRMTQNIEDILDKNAEKDMIYLTERFKEALN